MIGKATDETFRELVDHAIHNRLDDVAGTISRAGEKGYEAVAPLVIQAAAYICIYVSERWPNDADLKDTARIASESGTGLPVTAEQTHAYLSRAVFGTEQVLQVFNGDENAPVIPLFVLANLLVSFKAPQGKGWNAWLDVIENAIETAEQTRSDVLPALMYKVHAERQQR